MSQENNINRRRFLAGAAAGIGSSLLVGPAQAMRFPGDPPDHFVVYQLNKADYDYQKAILNSLSAMFGKYEDGVKIAVVTFGPGVHLLAKNPKREVSKELQDRVINFADTLGVEFVTCGNTMNTVGYNAEDMFEFARIEEVGASALMEYQEEGYAYIAW
ncbi:MAG: DsrE family protein [Halothiobacillaceae bacterium]